MYDNNIIRIANAEKTHLYQKHTMEHYQLQTASPEPIAQLYRRSVLTENQRRAANIQRNVLEFKLFLIIIE